jgi:hypothetical protein
MLSLRFPGHGMCMQVPCGARIQMFPELPDDADPTVECVVGPPGACVRFEVKRAPLVMLPQSLFTLRLLSGVGASENVVRLEEESPRLFPIVFGYLNHVASGSLNTALPSAGLSSADQMELWRLVDFLGVKHPQPSLLTVARSIEELPLVFKAKGSVRKVEAFCNGLLVCSGEGCLARIDLKRVPTEAPWPVSLLADKIHTMMCIGDKRGGKRARVDTEAPLPLIQCDEPETDEKAGNPYPYPVDFEDTFFIPAAAISVQLRGVDRGILGEDVVCEDVVCEGVFDRRDNSIRVDAIDTESYSWFWLSVEADLE